MKVDFSSVHRSCFSFPLALLVATMMMVGCGEGTQDDRPARAKVTGTVTHNGSPVEGATVSLQPASGSGQGAIGKTDASGKFTLTTYTPGDGALPGEYKISVSKVEVTSMVSEEEALKLQEQGRPIPPAQTKQLLPQKYGNTETSGLTTTVEADQENQLDIALEG